MFNSFEQTRENGFKKLVKEQNESFVKAHQVIDWLKKHTGLDLRLTKNPVHKGFQIQGLPFPTALVFFPDSENKFRNPGFVIHPLSPGNPPNIEEPTFDADILFQGLKSVQAI